MTDRPLEEATVIKSQEAARPATIKLFSPDRQSDRPADLISPAMTLAQFWTCYGRPVICKAKGLADSSVGLYDIGVNYWTQLTRDRAIEEIGEDDAADFLDGLRRQPGLKSEFLSPWTVARRAKDVQRILDLAGPRSRHSKWGRYASGMLEEVPYIEPPETPDPLPQGDFTHDEVLQILAACKRAKVHDDYRGDPAVFWRSLIIFLYYTGLRIRETMELRWADLDQQMLLIPAAIAKTKRARHKYVHAAALAAIAPLKGQGSRIFNWPNWPSAGAWRWLHRRREQLIEAAGLPESRRFGFHGLRKCHATLLYEGEEGADSSAAQVSLGHASSAVTMGHYVNVHTQLGKELKRQQQAIDRMPLLG